MVRSRGRRLLRCAVASSDKDVPPIGRKRPAPRMNSLSAQKEEWFRSTQLPLKGGRGIDAASLCEYSAAHGAGGSAFGRKHLK
jgi:hypothetical protein